MLHARGDVSDYTKKADGTASYAPRTWRCFLPTMQKILASAVCSTHVEMFLVLITRL